MHQPARRDPRVAAGILRPVAGRVLIVGWDGADWDILDPMLERGELPNLAKLIDAGQKGVV